MRIRTLSRESYLELLRVSKNQMPASLWLKGGKVLDVYLKEWREAHVVLSGERIAYVGDREPLTCEQTEIIDATGYYLVPGYIEPHAHPFQWYNPLSLSDYALACGTTTLISDNLFLYNSLPQEDVEKLMEQMAQHPVKQFFWARLDPQSQKQENKMLYNPDRLIQMVAHPLVVQAGELTDWGGILDEQEELIFGLMKARQLGKRIEGHHPGASWDTLNIAAAAGVTACHESINVDEVINRLRLGFYTSLRHSSIRPDLPELIKGLIERQIPWSSRLMITQDGSTPPMMREGMMDYCIRTAIEAGAPEAEAYVMATLNPAVYYGLDAEIGSIAPGRIADILLLASPREPAPAVVLANGKVRARDRQLLDETLKINWSSYRFASKQAEWGIEAESEWFSMRHPGGAVPVIQMQNAVITRMAMEELPCDERGHISLEHDPELAFAVLLDPKQHRITKSIIRGFGRNLEGLASTYTASADWIVLGRVKEMMAQALERVKQLGGGLAAYDQGRLAFELALPIAGMMSEEPMETLIAKGEKFTRFLRSKGHPHIDPIYSLLFLTATHLPFIRLTDEGIYDVKQRKILDYSLPLTL